MASAAGRLGLLHCYAGAGYLNAREQRRLWLQYAGVLWRIDMIWWFNFGLDDGPGYIVIEQFNDSKGSDDDG